MTRTILTWALVLAVGGFAIEWLQQQYLAHALSRDLYVSLIGVGVTGAAYAKAVAAAEDMRRQYANPLYRLPETFVEIFPVGFLVALVTAALVRNPKFLPARSRPV